MSDIKVRMMHAAVQVEDVKKSLDFFQKALGVKAAWSGQDDWGLLKSEGTSLALIQKSQNVHPPHVGFVVEKKEEVDASYERMKLAKVPGLEPPKDHRDKSRSFYFRDLDGNVFELVWIPENLVK